LSFADVVSETLHAKDGSFVMGKGFYNHPSEYDVMPMTTPAFSFGAQVAEVEVDQETGVVTLQKVTVAHDVGFAINPLAVEGQFDGQVFSGMAQALFEECIMKKGKVMNPSLLNYKLPRPFEMPGVERIIVESIDPGGPFGAKEVGEGPLVGSSAAIASAVRNAIGCQISEFPITPERVLRALKQKKKDQD
jgi:4-hydroxybenzoyl-CoA reductase subunit alpha